MTKQYLTSLMLLLSVFGFTACGDDNDPVKEDTPELITKVTLTFTPVSGSAITVNATDPDGDGAQGLQIDGPINLQSDLPYTLQIDLFNTLVDPSNDGYNINDEIESEGDEHIFYFSWTNDVFADPEGNGNIDSRTDDVNYQDFDNVLQPIGLTTSWRGAAGKSGEFRLLLKHQPGVKSETSTSDQGETDLDLTFTVNVN